MITPVRYKIFDGYPLIQANSTRPGGVSPEPFASLNLGLNTGDDRENVQQNRAILQKTFNLNPQKIVYPSQIHSDVVKHAQNGGLIPACDAIITQTKNLVLTIQTADCFPLFIYDPKTHSCGIVHSGWRGTQAGIALKTVEKMMDCFECKPENLRVAIGAGIQQKNYQVDSKTASFFADKHLAEDGPGHFKLAVQNVIIDQLLEMGVLEANIEVDTTCTFERDDLYYSYRRDNNKSGRMMGFIVLK